MMSWILTLILTLISTQSSPEATYKYSLVKNIDPEKLILVANYENKRTTAYLMAENRCKYGINGGFYGEDGKALGVVIVNSVWLAKEKNSRLLNGFIKIDKAINIDKNFNGNPVFALQTGPILIYQNTLQSLRMERDKQARRMVLGKDNTGKAFLLSVFDAETEKMGPFLADLPKTVKEIAEKEKMVIAEAVNLDGGRASAFYGENKILTEIDAVGSWWCVIY